jgi:phospholipid/cholesterol/gamma-HCH transport system permease protein
MKKPKTHYSSKEKVNDSIVEDNTIYLKNSLLLADLDHWIPEMQEKIKKISAPLIIINLDGLKKIDSAGVAALYHLKDQLIKAKKDVKLVGGNSSVISKLDLFAFDVPASSPQKEKISFFELIGEKFLYFFNDYIMAYLKLASDVIFWSVTDIFKPQAHRKGEFYNQAVLIGVNAVFIICLLSFIIGLVIALQSAAQLRNFGANIYIVDLIVISMMREMGPLITAILVAGRSGSAIAAEIATMKVTSELDAIKTMALNPVRFVIVPKMHGSIVTMPFLTILSDVMGILGGMLIAYLYLDIGPEVFINRMGETLYNRDILIGILKSLIFATLIVLTGSFFGLTVKEGAEGVGKVTTIAVVVAISIVIVADSIIGLIFY